MKPIEILIVTRSVVLQQGLGALLESLPQNPHVKATQDLQSAFHLIDEHRPKIVLLDETLLGREPNAALEKIHSLSPGTKRILLADEVLKVNLLLTHAEAIFIKGIAPASIASTVNELLSTKGDKHVDEK